ncbi:MAG TPA: DUF3592 domain-containing protein, partial [Ramlibacter sp.]|nr:DUF3592 domain-containing protein [Ramlibacter sp.]
MQITVHDDTKLVLHQGPWSLRAMGVLFAVSGSAVLRYITLGHLGEHNAWVALVVGGAFAIVAVAMAVLAGDLLCTFDRSTRTATLRHRRLVHSGTETYSWSDIQDAALEKTMMSGSQNSRPSPVYRPAFVMKNGTRVPWTQVYTGDLKRQANCVAAVRAFAGWHTLADEPQAADSAAIKRAAAGLRAARILVFPFLGIFVAVGAWLYVQQVRRYLMWRPERARIVSADIAASHDDKGNTTYRPVLSYAHRYGGGTVIATGATIINMSSSYGWADAIRERFRVGDSVTAYIDPGNPARGFVVRELS